VHPPTNPLDRFRLDDKVVVITGASSGLGVGFARAVAAVGATVVLAARREERLETLASELHEQGTAVLTRRTDVSMLEDCEALAAAAVEEFGRIDVLVNNAGDLVRRARVEELTDDEFERVLDLNLTAVFSACRQVLPVMRKQGGGAIVNLTSVAARTGGGGGAVAYATAKGAVSTFTRGLAKEVAGDGVRVNAVAPGIISTPFHERHTSDELLQAMLSGVPMGRAGTPEEIVGAVLFLASPSMSSYVTGQVIEVNGGQLTP
jgi:3-oxoacyl-[acyl-carrier protein] reductase